MPSAIVEDQPAPHSKPLFRLGRRSESLNFSRLSKSPKKKRDAGLNADNGGGGSNGSRFTFANRLRYQSDASSRRPLISAPTEFRHLGSGSGSLVQQHSVRTVPAGIETLPNHPTNNTFDSGRLQQHRHRQLQSPSPVPSLRPLELSIHLPHNRLSSLLPRFEVPAAASAPASSPSPTPPPAYVSDESAAALARPPPHPTYASALRSYPSFSFHIPRKHLRESPPPSPGGSRSGSLPRAAKKGRSRSSTAPGVDAIKERVANAMLEMEKLQKQIDDVIERQSMYSCSRPSSSHSMARTLPDLELEPMPSIPALPPSAPSFAQRLHGGADIERPRTAPAPPANTQAFAKRESSLPAGKMELPVITGLTSPPPPLPLILRPPLRKKKSFSKVSKWLFSSDPAHKRDGSFDALTNSPLPTKGRDGFYQSVSVPNAARASYDSLRSHSTTDAESESGIPSVFHAYSPATPRDAPPPLERCATFGQDRQHVRMSVGVAI